MSNQNESPPEALSNGSIGPIEALWQHFYRFNKISEAPACQADVDIMKFVHYTCAMQMYNAFVYALREDSSLLNIMTEGMRLDLTHYFNDSGPKVSH